MAFHDVRLRESITRNFVGGPSFQTAIVQLVSGFESRNINWSTARGRWDIGFPLSQEDFATIRAFFYARAGAAHSFRFKDWGDYRLGDDAANTSQSIGTGDGVEVDFQIFKRYTSGGISYDRNLTKIVANTTRVWVNAVEQMSGWTVDLVTGIITFSVAPPNTEDVAALCEFDTPVRFGTDELKIQMPNYEWGGVTSIPILEVRGE